MKEISGEEEEKNPAGTTVQPVVSLAEEWSNGENKKKDGRCKTECYFLPQFSVVSFYAEQQKGQTHRKTDISNVASQNISY